ncbi:MAG: ferrous iron transport protein A [Bacteroidota bacterium]|jgi:ferrous iron transport protein A
MQRRFRSIPDLKIHETARALSFSDAALACKLTSMGFLPGARVEMVRQSPFGNAFYVKVDGVRMALRREEAASILLEI